MKILRRSLFLILCMLFIPTGVYGAAKSASKVPVSQKNKAVVIRVSYATSKFDESYGGVMEAAPVKDTDVYTLYDVILWDDRISLYHFDGDINSAISRWFEAHSDALNPDDSTAYEKAWRKARESYSLKSFKVKNEEGNPTANSKKRLSAYKAFFKIVKKKTPSKHIVIKYSGHGGGASFCCSLSTSDTKTLLKYGVKLFGQKFALIDYGTNCVSGTSEVLNMYKDYADYMVVSQLDVGGWQWDSWDGDLYTKNDSDYVYDKLFVSGEKFAKTAKRVAAQHTACWPYGKKYMKKYKIAQSETAVNMKEYGKLVKSLKKISGSSTDLQTRIKKLKKAKRKALLKQYKKAIIYYKNNKSILGKWSTVNNGSGVWYYG